MSEPLPIEDVRKVARLSRLHLEDNELTRLGVEMGRILEYVRLLDEVDTEGVEPMPHAVPVTDVLRDDVPQESLSREDALRNAPKTDGESFLVPPIL